MAVFRTERTKDYTVMGCHHLRDKRLSLKAKGLLSLCLSLPEDWQYTIAGLAELGADGVASVRSAIKELEEAGYIQRSQSHAEGGTFAANEYIIRELPDSPLCENRTTAPLCSFPLTEKPLTENRTELNIDKPSIDNPPKPPKGGKRRRGKSIPDHEPELFENFWSAYPRGEDRQGAVMEWDRLRPDRELMRVMGAALRRQKATDEWQRGIGIPYATRWLRHRRWEDEGFSPIAQPEEASLPTWR